MGKIVKGLFYLLGLLISLTIILLIAIPLLVDPNDYRDEISELVATKTGRSLDIQGEIALSLFPWVGIELGKLSLSNAKGFGDSPFAMIERVDIKIKLLPLLRKAVEMDTIILHGLSLNLEKNQSGADNWGDLAQSQPKTPNATQEAKAVTAPPSEPMQESSPTEMLSALAINGLEINRAHIGWNDQSQQQQIEINNFNLVSGAIGLDSEFPLEIDFDAVITADASTPPIDGHIALNTLIKIDIEAAQYQLKQLHLKSDLKSPQLPGGRLETAVKGDLTADLQQQLARADGLTLSLLGIELILNSDISKFSSAPEITGDIALNIVQAAPLLELLGESLPEMINRQVLESTSINVPVNANIKSQQATLEQFVLNFDQSRIAGNASISNFSQPAIRYDFDIDQLNIDRYLAAANDAPSQMASTDSVATTDTAAEEPLPIPVELLRTLDIDGSLKIGALQVMNLQSQNIVTTVKAKGGDIHLAPLSANLYQGQFNGAISVDVRNTAPIIKVEERLTDVEAGPLLKDLLGKDYVSGKAQVNANMVTHGDRISQLKKGLNGKANVRFEDGSVNGIDIAQLIREARAAYKKEPVEKSGAKPKTDFALLRASFNIEDGLITNRDLSAQSPLLRISGAGTADLVSEKIDYNVKAAIVSSLEGQGGKELADLKGLTIPLAIKGTFSEPKFRVDLAKLLNAKSKAKLEAAKESARKES
ncbi:MAG: AsmA family protein, partial [Gammaproteobacteria bacterium]|nr:AsmA family protein [Gammaproteobacteria bacterium]